MASSNYYAITYTLLLSSINSIVVHSALDHFIVVNNGIDNNILVKPLQNNVWPMGDFQCRLMPTAWNINVGNRGEGGKQAH